jgi:hypothetical protein
MDGGGVAESGRGVDVVAGQPDGQVAAGVSHRQVALFADVGDGPTVAILDPVGGGETEPAVVGPGDDHISDTGPVPVGQRHLGYRLGVVEAMITGAAVEFGDKLMGGGERDRVQSGSSVGNPIADASSVVVAMSPTWTRP